MAHTSSHTIERHPMEMFLIITQRRGIIIRGRGRKDTLILIRSRHIAITIRFIKLTVILIVAWRHYPRSAIFSSEPFGIEKSEVYGLRSVSFGGRSVLFPAWRSTDNLRRSITSRMLSKSFNVLDSPVDLKPSNAN